MVHDRAMVMSEAAFPYDNPVKVVIFSVIGGTVLLCCCVCVLSAWADRDARKLAPQSPFDAKRKLNGLQEVTEHIELIGARPNDERPAGVDWSISTWSAKRGEYAMSDRGSKSSRR